VSGGVANAGGSAGEDDGVMVFRDGVAFEEAAKRLEQAGAQAPHSSV